MCHLAFYAVKSFFFLAFSLFPPILADLAKKKKTTSTELPARGSHHYLHYIFEHVNALINQILFGFPFQAIYIVANAFIILEDPYA